MTETISVCPVCSAALFNKKMELKDYFLTGEVFLLVECSSCRFRFINPRPGPGIIGRYYKSEEYISHGIKKNDPVSWMYQKARNFSISRKFRLLKRHIKGSKVLDIGCGTGEFLSYLKHHNLHVTGMEPNSGAREFAIQTHGLTVYENPDQIAEAGLKFDAITLWHVLEHIHDLNATLVKIGRILNQHGVLIIAVPNCESWDARHFGPYWAAYDVPRHLYHFTAATMKLLLRKHGFTIAETRPQKLDAYYVSMLSLKYKSGTGRSWMFPFYGLWSNLMTGPDKSGYSSTIFILKRTIS